MSDRFVLAVRSSHGPAEWVALPEDVDPFFEPGVGWPEPDRTSVLEQDSDDVIASETLEALRALGIEGPQCPDHHCSLGTCSSVWTCPEDHDGPFIGELAALVDPTR